MPAPFDSCSIDVQNSFGPTVAYGCLNGFDFTLLFEESILTLAPLLLTGRLQKKTFVAALIPYANTFSSAADHSSSACSVENCAQGS